MKPPRIFEHGKGENKDRPLAASRTKLSALLSAYSGTLLELSLAQASARLESIVMQEALVFSLRRCTVCIYPPNGLQK